MKGKALAAGAAVGAVVALGLGAREVTAESACRPPVSLLTWEQQASVDELERYIAAEKAHLFNRPATLGWYVMTADVKPSAIRALVVLGEDGGLGVSRSYNVVLERECAGGDWKVAKFELRGESPEPRANVPD